jgi:uncharacterized protein involved in type VI secretion and phage assembly
MSQDNLLDAISGEDPHESKARGINGIVVGIVKDNKDPEGLGRVKVHFPWLSEDNLSDWARVATFMAGADKGACFLPELDSEVIVAFEHADINCPFVLGAVHNIQDRPPLKKGDDHDNIKKIRTRSGNEIILDDTTGRERLEVHTKDGTGHKIILDNTIGASKISIQDETGLNSIEIDSLTGSVSISGMLMLNIRATNINVNSLAAINLNAPVINLNSPAVFKAGRPL